ncbi:MAG TPA: FtsX-like permease family protein, partial [Candidatus Moranbacteria bacterium]|nr:FtsX-like permease family protein [Candidatus Moranbacteria bacterium]
ALEELKDLDDGNPFFASLVIKARDSADYDRLAQLLKKPRYRDRIESVNYDKNREIIDRLTRTVTVVEKAGLFLGAVFALIAVLVVYNTVRMTMYARRKEFEVMRLVGASNLYIGLPSLFEALLYGLVATLIATALTGITAYGLAPLLREVTLGQVLFGFYLGYFWQILLGTFLLASVLALLSSSVAIKKHLKT